MNRTIMQTTLILVAAALVAPNSLALRDLPVSDPTCSKGDDDWGIGGVKVTCKFACTANNNISVDVRSEDNEAQVEGAASCGGANTDCDGPQVCSSDSLSQHGTVSSSAGEGGCTGRSDETFDSYVHVRCSADPHDVGPGGGTTGEMLDWCPVAVEPSPPYPRVCINGTPSPCQPFAPATDLVPGVDTSRCEVTVSGSTVLLLIPAGKAAVTKVLALVCIAGHCKTASA